MQKQRYNVIGFDKSQKMLNLTREKHYQNIYYQGEATALPFSNHQFEVILAASFINIVKEPEAILQEIKRVLKPSGKVFFFFPNDQMTLSNVHKYIEQKEYGLYSKALFYTWARRSPKNSIKEITTLVQSSGFKLISYHSYLDGMASSIGFRNIKNSI